MPTLATCLLFLLFLGTACTREDPEHSGAVMNYHRIDDRLVTGGHLIDNGIETLRQEGVKVVIDVRDNSPEGEQERYAEQGIEWINVPVDWDDPKAADFARFSEVMRDHEDEHVLVQCAANYRASGMTFLYRVAVENVPREEAAADMLAIWNPDDYDTWSVYIAKILAE